MLGYFLDPKRFSNSSMMKDSMSSEKNADTGRVGFLTAATADRKGFLTTPDTTERKDLFLEGGGGGGGGCWDTITLSKTWEGLELAFLAGGGDDDDETTWEGGDGAFRFVLPTPDVFLIFFLPSSSPLIFFLFLDPLEECSVQKKDLKVLIFHKRVHNGKDPVDNNVGRLKGYIQIRGVKSERVPAHGQYIRIGKVKFYFPSLVEMGAITIGSKYVETIFLAIF